MTSATLSLLESYTIDYLKKTITGFNYNKPNFTCPKCQTRMTAKFQKGTHIVECSEHGVLGNIIDLVRLCEPDFEDMTDDDIANYLIHILKINVEDDVTRILRLYAHAGFDLLPVSRFAGKGTNSEGKIPVEAEWQKKEHKSIEEWKEWVNNGSNIGIKTGAVSGITAIDVDTKKAVAPELVKAREEFIALCEESKTLVQETANGGKHFIFIHDEDIPQTVNFGGLQIDTRTGGGFIVAYPSVVAGHSRRWIERQIQPMPSKVKEIILKNTKKEVKNDVLTKINENVDAVLADTLKLKNNGLDGCCNQTFVQIGGMLRKQLSIEQTSYTLNILNKYLLESPMDNKTMNSMVSSISKYVSSDQTALKDRLIKHLHIVKEGTARDLKDSLKADKAELETLMADLVKDGLIYKQGSRYKLIERIEWSDTFLDDGKLLDYKVPYFDHIATIREKDIISIGAPSGTGKSLLAMNIIKQLVDQGKKPRLYNSESNNRIKKNAMTLGLVERDFYHTNCCDLERVELEENSINIFDWLAVSDFSKTAEVYQRFAKQLDKKGGILIIFNQLKKDQQGKLSFYANDMSLQFPSLVAKYQYSEQNGLKNNKETMLITEKIRESKVGAQRVIIPTSFNPQTGIVALRKTDEQIDIAAASK